MPPRGQHLFVRPATDADLPDLRRLTGQQSLGMPAEALIGRLIGETVAYLAFSSADPGRVHIEQIFVAPELRRKRIGRILVAELEELASRLQCRTVEVSAECDAREFFSRLGFDEENSVLRKSIKSRTGRW